MITAEKKLEKWRSFSDEKLKAMFDYDAQNLIFLSKNVQYEGISFKLQDDTILEATANLHGEPRPITGDKNENTFVIWTAERMCRAFQLEYRIRWEK